jgi:glutathione synthase/RimK-type ligase-like ATP-grasp enzyme
MILLWGIPSDGPLRSVERALQGAGAPVAFLDQRAVLDTEIELVVDGTVAGHLRVGDQRISLGDVTAAYLRPMETRRMPAVLQAGANSAEEGYALSVEDALISWAELTPARVLNRFSAMATNTSKPYQAALIREHGFVVPETLITTDPEAIHEFRARHGDVIYKSVSGTRSVVSRLGPEQLTRMDDLHWCPTQFQEYIPGIDHRVHVVGDEVFSCQIRSTADDFRYAARQGGETEMHACELPEDCAARCRTLSASLGLPLAGIDLRLTPDGDWCCFEVNPSPGFTYFQEATGQRIDEAIARYLMVGLKPCSMAPSAAPAPTAGPRSTRSPG